MTFRRNYGLKQNDHAGPLAHKAELVGHASAEPASLLSLHASMGNQNVGRLIQAKLQIDDPHDEYERQADSVAEAVTQPVTDHASTAGTPAAKPAAIQRQRKECEEEQNQGIRAKTISGAAAPVNASLESHVSSLQGRGEPLATDLRSYFEPRMGANFGDVHIHRDAGAAEAAQSLNALAFTAGRDIVFGAGQYVPGTLAGKKLLAHELTHVVQQRGATFPISDGRLNLDPNHSDAEREARGIVNEVTAEPSHSATRPSAKPSSSVISRADPQVVNISMNLGTAPRSGLQSWPTNVSDTRLGPVGVQGGLLSGGASRLHVIVAENETIRRLARQLLPLFLTATPFTPPGAAAALPLPVISENDLAEALLVYNQYYLQVPAMTNWRAGLNFPLPIEIDPVTGMATLHPLLISSMATAFSPAWTPLLDSRSTATVAPPAATVQADVATFLATQTTALDRGISLAARSLTNAVAELPFARESFHQLGVASFDVALAFMDNLVNHEVQQLASQRDGAAILTEIRHALAAPPNPPNATQQASLARANLMLGNVAGIAAVAPPTPARSRAEKAVVIDTVRLDGSNHTPSIDVAVANAIFTQCNVKLVHGVDATATPLQTTTWLGGNTDLRANPTCGSPSHEERAMFQGASVQFGLTGRIRAFFVASFSNNPGADAYSNPPFCATGAGAALRGMAVVENIAGKGVLAHECVHVIQDSPHHLPDPNLMGASPLSVRLNDAQCAAIYNKS